MSAAERRRLSDAAIRLLASDGPASRSATLARMLAGRPRAGVVLDDLAAAPDWMLLDPAARQRLGYRAALSTIANELSASIDGHWLGGLAQVAGDEDLDWAMSLKAVARLPRFESNELGGIADALLAAAAPPSLRGFVAAGERQIDPATAHAALAIAGVA